MFRDLWSSQPRTQTLNPKPQGPSVRGAGICGAENPLTQTLDPKTAGAVPQVLVGSAGQPATLADLLLPTADNQAIPDTWRRHKG